MCDDHTYIHTYLVGNANHNADRSIEVNRRMRKVWCSLRKYIIELYDRPSALLELEIRMRRAQVLATMLYGCVTGQLSVSSFMLFFFSRKIGDFVFSEYYVPLQFPFCLVV